MLASVSFAQPGGRPGGRPGPGHAPPLIQALDADKDGEISADEIANAAKNLKKLDKNEDGKLTRDELRPEGAGEGRPGGRGEGRPRDGRPGEGRGAGRPGFGANPEAMVKRMFENDTNEDGKLTANEVPEPFRRMIDRADKNDDKAVDREEALQFAKEMQKRFAAGGRGEGREGRPGEGRGPRPEGRPGKDRPNPREKAKDKE